MAIAALAAAAATGGAARAAEPARAEAVEFAGRLEAGSVYVAEVAYDANALRIWRPVLAVQVPKHHAWTIAWTNLEKFPALQNARTRGTPQRFRFRVVAADVSQAMPERPWTTIYRCELLAVEPRAGDKKPAPRKR